ncbi:MAG: histone deacetylase [Bacteroidia bacterium]|nr:histone deacetylase [Bacteroidia bacterium]
MFKLAYSPIYAHPLPEGHRFPMLKYELIPKQLLYEGSITEENLFEPNLAIDKEILLTHEKDYLQQLKSLSLDKAHIRRIGFPLSEELVTRELCLIQGTLDCALFALQYGVSINIAGGTHHAFANKGEGFCLLNDMAFAANALLQRKLVQTVLIIDLDVHQGNGTAAIFKGNKSVFTFSMHGKDNYPFHKEESDLDVPLENGMKDEPYLTLLKNNLEKILDQVRPDFIFYLCGVDVLGTDKLGKLNLTEEGCKQRDSLIFNMSKSLKVPVACAMGGGYSPKISDIVNAHCNTIRSAQRIFF